MSAFKLCISPDLEMQNGGLRFSGLAGMKQHYGKVLGSMNEQLTVRSFLSDGQQVAVHLQAHSEVPQDDPSSMFGSVRAGEPFDADNLILYQVANGKFASIQVAFLPFIRTDLNGVRHSHRDGPLKE